MSWTFRPPSGEVPLEALLAARARPALEWWGCASARCGASWTGVWGRRSMMFAELGGRGGPSGPCPYPH